MRRAGSSMQHTSGCLQRVSKLLGLGIGLERAWKSFRQRTSSQLEPSDRHAFSSAASSGASGAARSPLLRPAAPASSSPRSARPPSSAARTAPSSARSRYSTSLPARGGRVERDGIGLGLGQAAMERAARSRYSTSLLARGGRAGRDTGAGAAPHPARLTAAPADGPDAGLPAKPSQQQPYCLPTRRAGARRHSPCLLRRPAPRRVSQERARAAGARRRLRRRAAAPAAAHAAPPASPPPRPPRRPPAARAPHVRAGQPRLWPARLPAPRVARRRCMLRDTPMRLLWAQPGHPPGAARPRHRFKASCHWSPCIHSSI